jgi:hypothetical protein
MVDVMKKIIGEIANQTHPLSSMQSPIFIEQWGEKILEELKKRGYYINKAKGDPSGRW